MSGIKLLLILVIAVLIVVLFKYVQIKRQIRNLSKQMTDLTTGKSEKMLDISLVDKDIEQLAAVLNQYNEKQRQSIASILNKKLLSRLLMFPNRMCLFKETNLHFAAFSRIY